MELNGVKRLAIVIVMMLGLMLTIVEGHEGHKRTRMTQKACYADCIPRCTVNKPLWCATLCIGKCKHGLSIPDNLCNCTYACSKFMCEATGSDPEKIRRCVSKCSRICNIKY